MFSFDTKYIYVHLFTYSTVHYTAKTDGIPSP